MWITVCFCYVIWSPCCRCSSPPIVTTASHILLACILSFGTYLIWENMQVYKGRCGTSVQKWVHSNPFELDFSNFYLWNSEYSMDFCQIAYRHPLWDVTLSLLVSGWVAQRLRSHGHFCIIVCLLFTIFMLFFYKWKMWPAPSHCPRPGR